MKNIYLIQASSLHITEMPLPYAAAAIEAYALQNVEIRNNYKFEEIIFEKLKKQEILKKLEEPYLIGFSCYIWNYEYNLKMAEEIKKVFPKVKILFGGHSVPTNSTALLEKYKFIDYLIFGEGELAFTKILVALENNKSLDDIANIAYRINKNIVKTEENDLQIPEQFPSPYKLGLLDSIIEKNKDKYHFTGTIETNRGCPFSCGYCDWGWNRVPIRKIPYTRVVEDIEWMGTHGIYTCYGADSNFGMFQEDASYAEKLVETKKKYGYPKKFFVSFSKNSDDRVFQITKVFNEVKMLQGATLSFQSLNKETLDAIGRKNMGLEKFRKLMERYNSNGIKTYSEIILGLPMETFETFVKGIGTLIENGQHHSINIYNFELLPNSYLGQEEAVKKYGFKTQKVPFRRFDILSSEEIQENSTLVCETNTMPFKEWCKAHLFGCMIKVMHCGMLTDCIAMYYFQHYHISYQDFYIKLFNWCMNKKNNFPLAILFKRIMAQLEKIGQQDFCWEIECSEYGIETTSFENAIRKLFVYDYEKNLYEMIRNIGFEDSELTNQVIIYQEAVIQAMVLKRYDVSYEFKYALHEYFDAIYLNEPARLINENEKIDLSQMKKFYHCGYRA